MNVENIRTAIAVMQRVIDHGTPFSMEYFQGRKVGRGMRPVSGRDRAVTEDTLHACGNSACFAGFLEVSPEWKASVGQHPARGPQLADWMGIPASAASLMIYNYTPALWRDHILYQKPWDKIQPKDVIAVLERLLAEGPDFIVSRFTEYHTLP